jgi:segregation and condensation protein B
MTQEKEKKEESENFYANFENQANSVEAVLFASGKPMTVDEISKICKLSGEEVLKALEFLKKRYESGTSLTLMEYNNAWKLTVREKFIGNVRKIVPHTELTKTLLETLAVIAWKAPVLQSDIIKIRTNKAYDHINELAEEGFITKEKHGKTALLKLTKKFYDYFEIDETTDLSKILNKMQPRRKKPEVEFYGEKEKIVRNKQNSVEKKLARKEEKENREERKKTEEAEKERVEEKADREEVSIEPKNSHLVEEEREKNKKSEENYYESEEEEEEPEESAEYEESDENKTEKDFNEYNWDLGSEEENK